MDPINYMAALPQIDFMKTIQAGLQTGSALRERDLQSQQHELALQQQQQYQSDIKSVMAAPTPQGFASLALKYPAQREAVKQAWDGMSEGDRKQEGDTMAQAYSALLAGKQDVAKQVVQAQVEARKNSGLDTSHYDNALTMLDGDPKQALGALGFTLSHIADPKDFAAKFGSLQGEQRTSDMAPAGLRKANADAGTAEADGTLKSLGIIGSKAGALAQAKDVKPAQVATMFQSLAKQGHIPKEELPDYLASIPQDPKAIPAYLNTYKLAGMKPDDQMKFTTPDANTVANNQTSRANTASNNATQLAVQDRIAARQDAKGDAEPTLEADTLSMMAQQYLAGDKSVMQNLGRGAQGAANIVALRQQITAQAKASGMTGPQIAAQMADYAGQTAGLRTSGTISARIENAAAEAAQLAPLALSASEKVARSGLLPFGKAQIMFDTQTNDPALSEFAAANVGLATAYAGAMARGGKATVSDNEHAREMLSTAKSHTAYKATVNQMLKEIEAARRAPNEVREHLRNEIGGKSGHSAAPAIPSGWSVREH